MTTSVALGLVLLTLLGSLSGAASELSLLGTSTGVVTQSLAGGCSIEGLQYDGFEAYLGIPYAEPPVGDLRWQMAVPTECSGSVVAQKVQPACPQPSASPLQGEWEDEDCLYLNVWRPAGNETDLPVMVYIHGGGWITGAGSLALYFGQHIASQDVILVTLNYRLGALGFLVTPDIPGNFGFVDQRTALEWVQTHIASFGGDADRVTLFGQSAGGISVSTHLTAPKSFGNFNQVINHSGPTVLTYRTQEETYPIGEKFTDALGCDSNDLSCMRAASWQDVVAAQEATGLDIEAVPIPLNNFFSFMPVIDGDNILESPQAVINRNGIAPNVDVVWGSTRNETAGWIYLTAPNFPLLPIEYKAFLAVLFGERDGRKVFQQYPADDADDVRYQMAMLSVDFGFTCNMRHNAMATSTNSTSSHTVKSYVFMHPPSSDPRATGTVSDCASIQEVCHGAELDYVFHTAALANASFTQDEESLSQQTSALWTSYAKGTLLDSIWPDYTAVEDDVLAIDYPAPYVLSGYRQEYCDFWESLNAYTQPF